MYRNEELLDQADLLMKEGRIEEAMSTLHEILSDDPLFGKAHNHLGYLYETKIQDYPKAEEHYKVCLATTPEYRAVYYNYAILLSTLKKFEALRDLLSKAQKVPGINRSTISNEWAILCEAQGAYDQAIQHYRDVITESFDNKSIDLAMDSIHRCEKKKAFLANEGQNTTMTADPSLEHNDTPPGLHA